MTQYKTILFDNDGILVQTEDLYFEANHQILSTIGVELTYENFIKQNLLEGISPFDELKKSGHDTSKVDQLKQARDVIYTKLVKTRDIITPGCEAVLSKIYDSQKFQMAVVTSSQKQHFQSIHTRTGFTKYFDFIIDRSDVIHSKPSPEPYLKALEKAQKLPESCLVIEDSQRGLRAAKAAGIDCWVIPNELTKNQDFSEADKVLGSIEELRRELL